MNSGISDSDSGQNTKMAGLSQNQCPVYRGMTVRVMPESVSGLLRNMQLESAKLVLDQNYTPTEAANAMNVGVSTMTRWVRQLKDERQGKPTKAAPMTPEQIEIRELKKKLQRIEMENEILKKATALLMSDSLNNSR